MTPRLARMALAAFAVLAVGVTYNALRRQEGATVDAKAVAEQAHPRTGERQERTEKAKPGRVKPRHSASAPDAVTADAPADATDPVGAETVRAIQRELKQRGYGPLANDGVMRPVTRAAIMAFEHENRLPLTGEATEGLLRHLVLGVPAAPEVVVIAPVTLSAPVVVLTVRAPPPVLNAPMLTPSASL